MPNEPWPKVVNRSIKKYLAGELKPQETEDEDKKEASSLASQVRELELRCVNAERRLAEVRATLLVNLKPGRVEGMTAREALQELLLRLFHEEPPKPE